MTKERPQRLKATECNLPATTHKVKHDRITIIKHINNGVAVRIKLSLVNHWYYKLTIPAHTNDRERYHIIQSAGSVAVTISVASRRKPSTKAAFINAVVKTWLEKFLQRLNV